MKSAFDKFMRFLVLAFKAFTVISIIFLYLYLLYSFFWLGQYVDSLFVSFILVLTVLLNERF